MNAYYDILDQVRTVVLAEDSINAVTQGTLDEVALDKFTDWGLGHIVVNSVTQTGGVLEFNLSLIVMDKVGVMKEDSSRISSTYFRGHDNEMDVLNSTLATCLRVAEVFRRGDIMESGYQLTGNPSYEPFVDRFTNPVTGWVMTFNLITAHNMQHCD